MNQIKIGSFFKMLRKEKGLTQEQLAEQLNVSSRTVSRWETGSNMPDISLLVQIAEFYDVSIPEIIDGERKSENMNEEVKDALQKIAEYDEMLKNKEANSTKIAYCVTFSICAITILIQMYLNGQTSLIAGETVVLLVSGFTYLILLIKDGTWEVASRIKNTKRNHLFVSLSTSLICSQLFYRNIIKMGMTSNVLTYSVIFFVGITIAGYVILRLIFRTSQRK